MTTVVLAIALAAAVGVATRRPYLALSLLVLGLPLHSGLVLIGRNVIDIEPTVMSLMAAWKEAILLGLLVAAGGRLWRDRLPFSLPQWLALLLVVLIAARIPVDVERGGSLPSILTSARLLAEPLLVFLAVTILAPSYGWLRRTAQLVAPILIVVAYIGIVQPMIGSPLYDAVYHQPGETLHHSYVAQLPSGPRLRAVGGSIAPNEFGLTLVIYLSALAAPLLVVRDRWRFVAIGTLAVGLTALLLSFSRSAWLGAASGLAVTLFVGRHGLRRSIQRRQVLATRTRLATAVALGAAVLGLVVVSSGAAALLIDTVTGQEPSAAGRGASIAHGIDTALRFPMGAGLGTAGPRALEFEPRPFLTEAYYLVIAVQLGWLPTVVYIAFIASVLLVLGRRVQAGLEHERRGAHSPADRLRYYPAAASAGVLVACVGAFAGAIFIPAVLDLATSLPLWAVAGVVIGHFRRATTIAEAPHSGAAGVARSQGGDMLRIAVAGIAAWALIGLAAAPWRPSVTGIAITAQKGDTGSRDGYPENTLEAVVQAAHKGADAVEFDVQRSAQGTWFVILDPNLDRTTDATGPVAESADAVIEQAVIDGGIGYEPLRHGRSMRVPRLLDVLTALEAVPSRIHLDIKETSPSAHEALARLVVREGWEERTTINCKSIAAARAVRAVSPRIETTAQLEYIPDAANPIASIDVWLARHTEIHIEEGTRSPRAIEVFVHLESLGVDEVDVMQQAQRFGASSFMTNDLDRVLDALLRGE